jgi:thiosulfate/3-mercaptopyruvate sulfurtransferase
MGIRVVSFSMALITFLAACRLGRAWVPSSSSLNVNLKRTYRRYSKYTSLQAQQLQPDADGTTTSSNLLSLERCLELYGKDKDSNSNINIKFVDGSWYHKGERNGRNDFEAGPRIPGSIYFDLTDICATESGLYTMLPSPELFAAACTAWNICETDHVIIYGRDGAPFTPRVWFTWKQAMGHKGPVSLMQASLEEWIAAGGPVEDHNIDKDDDDEQRAYVVRAQDLDLSQEPVYRTNSNNKNPSCVADLKDMMGWVTANNNSNMDDTNDSLVDKDTGMDTIIVDARGSSFKKGHMPGAIHIPYSSLTDPTNALKLAPPNQLRDIFLAAGVDTDTDKRIVCSCGSGVSACNLYLALKECGRTGETLMYDGSWNEWGSHPETPKVLPKTAN